MTNYGALRELAGLFLRLGTTAFGGPVAHIAMMEDEVVTRRKWLDRQHFLDLIGATNLIPGPNSTELAIHIGKLRGGWPGLVVAGTCFVLPAMCIVIVLAWLYAQYGGLPQTRGVMLGVQPVVVAIIGQALWRFMQTALRTVSAIAVAAIAAGLLVAGVHELTVIALAALAGLALGWLSKFAAARAAVRPVAEPESPSADDERNAPDEIEVTNRSGGAAFAVSLTGGVVFNAPLWQLFLVFLKIGSVVYGSGYVLIAFLRADLVERLHWLTDRQLLDAISIGQITPGPVFTTATFIGYQLHGLPGAIVATVGIFLPSFLFVGMLSILMERLRQSQVMRSFLDSVNAASLALMAVVTAQLAVKAFAGQGHADFVSITVATSALFLLLRTRINSVWLLAGGAVIGALRVYA
jgi:chromate transporter